MMSANITAASTPCRRTGWSVTSAVSSAERLISKNAWRSRSSRYSGSDRPACRMNHTGRPLDGLAPRGAHEQRFHAPRLAAHGEGPSWPSAWGAWKLDEPQAGRARRSLTVELENTGTVAWGETVLLAYHWLDTRDNPIVWDGYRIAASSASRRASVDRRGAGPGADPARAATGSPPTSWSSTGPGSRSSGAPSRSPRSRCFPRRGAPQARASRLGRARRPDWQERVAAAHAEGYGVVAGSVDWLGGLSRRRPHELEPYEPGPGRITGFSHPLLCPSVLDGITLDRLPDVAGLPAYAAPLDEPWIFDGRIVLRADPRARGQA